MAVEIHVGRQLHGYTCALAPDTRTWVGSHVGNTPPVASVYVSYETHADFPTFNGPISLPIAEILTGLSALELEELGVEFRDPVNPDQLLDNTKVGLTVNNHEPVGESRGDGH